MTTTPTSPVELDPSLYDQAEQEMDAAANAGVFDFDQFWRDQNPVQPARIRGKVVVPPIDVPLRLINKMDQLEGSSDIDSIKELLSEAYARDIITEWADAGMGLREFQCVLAWTGAAMRGQAVSFEDAVRLAEAAVAEYEEAGKAGNRKTRRAAARGRSRSGGTGA